MVIKNQIQKEAKQMAKQTTEKIETKEVSVAPNKASDLRLALFEKYAPIVTEAYGKMEKKSIKPLVNLLSEAKCQKPDLVRYFLIGAQAKLKGGEVFQMCGNVPEYRFLAVDLRRLKEMGKNSPFAKVFKSRELSKNELADIRRQKKS